jgi:hypothetical protein
MRPGRAVVGFSSNQAESAPSASAGNEIVIPEESAAFLIRQRAAEIIEVIEGSSDGETDRD